MGHAKTVRIAETPMTEQSSSHFATASEFRAALDLHGSTFPTPSAFQGWFYRGHANSRWRLVPSALRPRARLFHPERGWVSDRATDNRSQIAMEAGTLLSFAAGADAIGLKIPEDSYELRNVLREFAYGIQRGRLDSQMKDGTITWPPDEVIASLALAQHHGLPTRLIDFTRSPLVAAYFAAVGAISLARATRRTRREPSEKHRLRVIGMNHAFLDRHIFRNVSDAYRTQVFRVSPPAADNAHLIAQRGLFILRRPSTVRLDESVDRRPLDIQLASDRVMPKLSSHELRSLTLPWSEAPCLLKILAIDGITAATLFRDHAGVVRSLEEERLWS